MQENDGDPAIALYYTTTVGELRTYRRVYPCSIPRYHLLVFSRLSDANAICDQTNKIFNESFEPVAISTLSLPAKG